MHSLRMYTISSLSFYDWHCVLRTHGQIEFRKGIRPNWNVEFFCLFVHCEINCTLIWFCVKDTDEFNVILFFFLYMMNDERCHNEQFDNDSILSFCYRNFWMIQSINGMSYMTSDQCTKWLPLPLFLFWTEKKT